MSKNHSSVQEKKFYVSLLGLDCFQFWNNLHVTMTHLMASYTITKKKVCQCGNQRGSKKIPEDKSSVMVQNLWDAAKASLRGHLLAVQALH